MKKEIAKIAYSTNGRFAQSEIDKMKRELTHRDWNVQAVQVPLTLQDDWIVIIFRVYKSYDEAYDRLAQDGDTYYWNVVFRAIINMFAKIIGKICGADTIVKLMIKK